MFFSTKGVVEEGLKENLPPKVLFDFSDGNILSYGSEDLVICPNYEYDKIIDCNGGTILPDILGVSSTR
ncbi:hypothetical protein ACTXT7_012365 [Hymenolepis weldensis]